MRKKFTLDKAQKIWDLFRTNYQRNGNLNSTDKAWMDVFVPFMDDIVKGVSKQSSSTVLQLNGLLKKNEQMTAKDIRYEIEIIHSKLHSPDRIDASNFRNYSHDHHRLMYIKSRRNMTDKLNHLWQKTKHMLQKYNSNN